MPISSDIPSPTVATSASGSATFVKYPADIGSPPFEKWMLFEVKSGRHIGRTGVVGETGTNVDRTIKAVAVYLPANALRSSLSVDWQQDEYGAVAGEAIAQAIQSGTEIGSVSTSLNRQSLIQKLAAGVKGDVAAGLLNTTYNAAAGAISQIGNLAGGNAANGRQVLEGLSGSTVNPRTDLFFKSVQYRTHEFTFTLIPRSLDEARQIDTILNIFQYYMLPSFGDDTTSDSFFIGYPYEFVISMFSQYSGGSHHINSIDRSVLEGIVIDHASSNRVAFVDTYGGVEYYPASTTLSLRFKEVRLQGRDKQSVIWRGTDNTKSAEFMGTANDPRFGKGIDQSLQDLPAQIGKAISDAADTDVLARLLKVPGHDIKTP